MDPDQLYTALDAELAKIKESKTFKYEVPLESEQGGQVTVGGHRVVMLASNNYLGLSNHPRIKEAAHRAIDEWGYGLASVRFLCGTEPIHFELERRIAQFVGCEAAILHSSCFAANEAFFTGLLANDLGQSDYQDVIYSDQLNHASI
ncbi:MAG TPA: aminotransferase class I/II-fold pyridoxal phosphate-dependent enzyme, partial [Blastocatellia bacterium]|nr:aminotransferase class I/II-fold pyridoxal phosphate-dependent enzyme [Blastocatellia bacterium]